MREFRRHQSSLSPLLLLLLQLGLYSAVPVAKRDVGRQTPVDLLMPDVQPVIVDSYLCHTMKMAKDPLYIIGFQPRASMKKAHHVLIYGCTVPGSAHSVWDCGEMHTSSQSFETAPVCGSESAKIIYAWAMDAPELHLPANVGFKVGGDTDIQYLVLQVHYKDVSFFQPPKNETDHSGVTMITTETPQPKRAGVYLMGTGGQLAAHSTTYFETACSYNEPFVMHPFAYRTHAHTHGRVNAGYRVRNGNWLEIGRMSPLKPQMFYNVTHPGMTVKNGDILAARCTMVNDEDRTIKIGATSNDEMCNFYIMYYVDGDHQLSQDYCFSAGPPTWSWANFGELTDALAPPLTASVVPGTEQIIEATDRVLDRMEESMNRQHERMNAYMERLLAAVGGTDRYPAAEVQAGPEPAGGDDVSEYDAAAARRLSDVIGNEIYEA
jgi:peptidylglycine monooxygenase